MTNPTVHDYPVKRPNFIKSASWVGDDSNLKLHVTFLNEDGSTGFLEFQTRNATAGRVGEICLPSGLLGNNDPNDLGPRARDILVAHTRMACMVAGQAVPGSQEFLDAFTQDGTNDLQTAIGTVKVSAVTVVNDVSINMSWRKGSGPIYTQSVDHQELNLYQFVPDTQLLIIPGSVKKQFSTYYHDYPNTLLSDAQKDAIAAYVLALSPWI